MRRKSFSIRTRLLLWFVLVACVSVAAAGCAGYTAAQRALKNEVLASLSAIAQSKGRHLDRYARERQRATAALGRTPAVIEALDAFSRSFRGGGIDSPEYEAAAERSGRFLKYYMETLGFSDLYLISSDGDAVFSVVGGADLGTNYYTGPYSDSELARVFDSAKTLLETPLSDFEYYPATNRPAAFVAAPVFKDRVVIGVVALQMSNEDMYALVSDYTGLGETGETLVASRSGNEAVVLTPVRHDDQAAFRMKAVIGSGEAPPLEEAVQGKQGSGVSVDYRGHEVLAVWSHLPRLRWGMAVKIDTAEAFSPVARLRNYSLVIAALTTLGAALVAHMLARSISRPIVELTQSTETVARGDLAHRLAVRSADEVGRLGESFNRMLDDLIEITASRDQLDREVAARRRAEAALQQHAMELARSNADLEEFAYVASHDLQEPLRKITAFGDRLAAQSGDALEERGRDYLERMQGAARRMQGLINGLLTYSRLTTKAQPFEPVALSEVAGEVVADLELRIQETGARVQVGSLPIVPADALQMRQLLQNLIGNALKFGREGAPPVVRVDAAVDADVCRLAVSDNGIGFDMKHADRIFGVFQRLHPRDRYEGTGMGLAICRKIAERHGGEIRAQSTPGSGATFAVTLPLHQDEEAMPKPG